jgi:hypothetical protein
VVKVGTVMKRLVCAGVLFVVSLSAPALGQDKLYPNFKIEKYRVVHGQGSSSCGTFIKNQQPSNIQTGVHSQDMAWVLGFLHGIDMWNPYDTKRYDYNGLELWLEGYCRKNPLEWLVNAANQFYVEIGGRAPISQDYTI